MPPLICRTNARSRHDQIPLAVSIIVAVSFAVLLAGVPAPTMAGASAVRTLPPDDHALRRVVTIPFASREDLGRLAQRLDIWTVVASPHHDDSAGGTSSGTIISHISPGDEQWLRSQGFAYETLSVMEALTIPDYPCYRTVDELTAQLDQWAGEYPALAELITLGTSYEGRPLRALRLTNRATGLEKPILFVMANIHGRELITPEVAMVFAEVLLEGYGTDLDMTWLLDQHRIEILVTANPDGHVRNEADYLWTDWRKNANPTYGICGGTTFGIDLNRNSSYAWGGASSNPCALTYQGPTAASETETQAVESYIRELFPDQRLGNAAAPLDTTGLFISLHSYSNLVLWPWGYTTIASPNAMELAQLGKKLATFNGYTAQQASALYPASGTTDDFAYGELGVAAYTFEIGGIYDGFYAPCSRYDALVQPNVEALLYAAKVARTPYLTPAGPDALDVDASATLDPGAPVITVTARVDDRSSGNLAVAGAEVFLDRFPWEGGVPVPAVAVDGAFDSSQEAVRGTLLLTTSLAEFLQDRHAVYVRGQDSSGAWGPFTAGRVEMVWALALTPSAVQGFGKPGGTVDYTFWLTNTGGLSQAFSLTQTSTHWPTTLVPTHTLLMARASTSVTLSVAVPDVIAPPFSDTLTITVQSEEAPWVTETARVETRALWASLFLPFAVRSD